MWSAKCTYLSQMGTYVAKVKGTSPEVLINRFFGIFFCMFQTWGIWGNIVTATGTVVNNKTDKPISLDLSDPGQCCLMIKDPSQ